MGVRVTAGESFGSIQAFKIYDKQRANGSLTIVGQDRPNEEGLGVFFIHPFQMRGARFHPQFDLIGFIVCNNSAKLGRVPLTGELGNGRNAFRRYLGLSQAGAIGQGYFGHITREPIGDIGKSTVKKSYDDSPPKRWEWKTGEILA